MMLRLCVDLESGVPGTPDLRARPRSVSRLLGVVTVDLDAEREQLKKLYSEAFYRNVDSMIDKMSDGMILRLYMRLKLQGKIKKKD